MDFQRGNIVVLEGLDKAGKSTQAAALATMPWEVPPTFVHMPSGFSGATEAIYRVTETYTFASSLGLQLLHLACHAESIPRLLDAQRASGVILDRWWWSTVAYGWFGSNLRAELDRRHFFGAMEMVWGIVEPAVVFLFLKSYEPDPHNSPDVLAGYRWVADRSTSPVVEVPRLAKDDATAFIVSTLRDLGIVSPDG